jgi:hypothetical protein
MGIIDHASQLEAVAVFCRAQPQATVAFSYDAFQYFAAVDASARVSAYLLEGAYVKELLRGQDLDMAALSETFRRLLVMIVEPGD